MQICKNKPTLVSVPPCKARTETTSTPLVTFTHPLCYLSRALILSGALLLGNTVQAATSVWSVDLTFDAFAGQPGGFADDSQAPVTLRNQANAGSISNSYDVVQPVGQGGYGLGQDGVADLTIRTTLIDGSDGRWAKVAAEQRRGLRMNSAVDIGTSKSGDYALVAYEISFASGLGITADQLAVRLSSANGSSQLYEWSMVTGGGMADAPFTSQQIANYNSSIYNAGAPTASGNGDALETGRSISQYLAGAPVSPWPSGGEVASGWWAIDDFNTRVANGAESFGVYGGEGRIDDNQTVTGANLGLTGQPFSTLTVWFGLHDVAFDTDGDGFTLTEAAPQASITGLTFGGNLAAIPEAGTSMFLLSLAAIGLRRRR